MVESPEALPPRMSASGLSPIIQPDSGTSHLRAASAKIAVSGLRAPTTDDTQMASTISAIPIRSDLVGLAGFSVRYDGDLETEPPKTGDGGNALVVTPVTPWVVGAVTAHQIFYGRGEREVALDRNEELLAGTGPVLVVGNQPSDA